MDIQEVMNSKSNFSFELEDKTIIFNRVLWNDALKAQTAFHLIATNDAKNIEEANRVLFNLALKYIVVEVEGKTLEKLNADNFNALFENPFVCIEVSKQFQDYIGGFLERLPSFKALN